MRAVLGFVSTQTFVRQASHQQGLYRRALQQQLQVGILKAIVVPLGESELHPLVPVDPLAAFPDNNKPDIVPAAP